MKRRKKEKVFHGFTKYRYVYYFRFFGAEYLFTVPRYVFTCVHTILEEL